MIQVCAQCGTRWNVRERRRVWCPRCNGTLLAPTGSPAGQPVGGPGRPANPQVAAPRARSAFRWIAVRPGPPPPPRTSRRPLGPTPRYHTIPRWGLVDRIVPAPGAEDATARKTASAGSARTVLLVTAAVFALAAAAHILRYLLMLINRTTLLPPLVAFGSLITGVLVSLGAIVAVVAAAVVLTSWLIGRRAAAFARHGQDDPRPELTLWAGCLIPVLNWFYAPLFLLELAQAEGSRERQSRPIALWSIAWIVATLISAWATWTGLRASLPQAVADNTVTTIIAYLAGLAVLVLLWRVIDGFVRRPVARPLHRWVIVHTEQADETTAAGAAGEGHPPAGADDSGADDSGADEDGSPVAPVGSAVTRDREPAV